MHSDLILMDANETAFFGRLGQRIAELRRQQGYTQAELAQRLAVKQYVVASYETGRRRPSAALLPELAAALGASVEDLLGVRAAGGAKRGPASKLERLTEQLARLPRARQRFVVELLENAVAKAQ